MSPHEERARAESNIERLFGELNALREEVAGMILDGLEERGTKPLTHESFFAAIQRRDSDEDGTPAIATLHYERGEPVLVELSDGTRVSLRQRVAVNADDDFVSSFLDRATQVSRKCVYCEQTIETARRRLFATTCAGCAPLRGERLHTPEPGWRP